MGWPATQAADGDSDRPSRPNIIVVLADDLGWGDVGYHGGTVPTPNIDAMAGSGLRLNRQYVMPCCSPTRGCLLTGRNANRFECRDYNGSIHPRELTIAQVLKEAGYATGIFGKWHLYSKPIRKFNQNFDDPARARWADPVAPGKMGFEHLLVSDGFNLGGRFYDTEGNTFGMPERTDGSVWVTEQSIKWMDKQLKADKPFFSYVSFSSPHYKHFADPELKREMENLTDREISDYDVEVFGVDKALGRIRKFLKDRGADRNTIVWFLSDNGPDKWGGSTGKLRGRKFSMYEGGIRVPAVVDWPATVAKPRTTDAVIGAEDIAVTLAAAAGQAWPDRVSPIDGVNQLDVLRGKADARSSTYHSAFLFRKSQGASFDGRWKLVLSPTNNKKPHESAFDSVELYDIAEDPAESTNVADKAPDRVKAMRGDWMSWARSVSQSMTGADYRDG